MARANTWSYGIRCAPFACTHKEHKAKVGSGRRRPSHAARPENTPGSHCGATVTIGAVGQAEAVAVAGSSPGELGSLTAAALLEKVKDLQNLAYKLGIEESREMTRGRFLDILRKDKEEEQEVLVYSDGKKCLERRLCV
nr:uncharacterized protein LOC126532998 isoform X2 [Dermacentor andersoni]XP_054927641.1 uncharacterized protein LOC126532998 isoform X2 [Dermacentor andersoni]XP_054927642.1 uncharacterized protein LOC126532998 isoform X2 [Dermacentor andersoni]XP_054927644.1 uncharacterized protein LOC126532998 isoform X2 [Dermacentor andersoni]XP_054927645.1 uncharacterized protein LOC126532998 isoform X2 [Dermacentor andersoni]